MKIVIVFPLIFIYPPIFCQFEIFCSVDIQKDLFFITQCTGEGASFSMHKKISAQIGPSIALPAKTSHLKISDLHLKIVHKLLQEHYFFIQVVNVKSDLDVHSVD